MQCKTPGNLPPHVLSWNSGVDRMGLRNFTPLHHPGMSMNKIWPSTSSWMNRCTSSVQGSCDVPWLQLRFFLISRSSLVWLPNGGSGVGVGVCHAVFGVCVDGGQDSPLRQTCCLLEQLQYQVSSSHTHTHSLLFDIDSLHTWLHDIIQTMWQVFKVW